MYISWKREWSTNLGLEPYALTWDLGRQLRQVPCLKVAFLLPSSVLWLQFNIMAILLVPLTNISRVREVSRAHGTV